ncbi:FUN14 domain-containing protein 2 [Sapajus apella]|uniref:FUN14 domain-containing protein 2 n=2 Tax=Platyrrhini TaxID=9479 RepID=A0A6J3GUC4_SAPAP|nr:FUN14 domain-containing protein 2 [Sapajus apella]
MLAETGSGRRAPGPPSSVAAVGMETSAPRAGSQVVATTARHSDAYRADPLRVSSRDEVLEMAASSQGNFEGNFESLDLAEFAKKQPWWRKLFGQESGPSAEKYSVATQLFIGGVTGWCTGFIFQKVGKLAATAVGGGFFLLQLANHTGYIKVDWQRVEKDMKKAKEQLKIRKSNQIPTEVRSKAEEVVSFVKKNVLVTGGFFGGFLLGMAS